ncbi:hypothetical protein BDB01DRAFT_737249 [Pilobolus umbonatus]|nr:hypothetical protein BDB01DRAFT_737249 [Pilobolus umbonatus]
MRSFFYVTLAALATAISAVPASVGPNSNVASVGPNSNVVALEKRAAAKIYSTCSVPGTIALTFDDGPYQYTWALAESLAKEGIRATFFMNGNNWVDVEKQSVKTPAGTKTYKQVIKHVYDLGHQIASHTYSHQELAGLSSSQVTTEMTKLEKIFRSILGKNPTYFRPPAGSYTQSTINTLGNLGYKVIMWDIDSNDWQYAEKSSLSKEQGYYEGVIEKDNKKNPKGHIALHHDVYKKTAEKLVPWVIKYIKSKKTYKFVTVAECLGNTKGSAYKTKQ